MADITALIERLVAAGCDPVVAACCIAEAVVAGKDAAPFRDNIDTRSRGAIRQQRYRDRNASVTKRNANVTERNENEQAKIVTERNETVTNRNENVTPLRPDNSPIYLSSTTSIDNQEKKERKKERIPRKRNAPLPDDWSPNEGSYRVAEQYGQNVQIVEQIFRDYLKSSGKIYADYDAAFNNFIRNQKKFNGGASHGTSQANSVSAVAKRWAEQFESERGDDLAGNTSSVLRIPSR